MDTLQLTVCAVDLAAGTVARGGVTLPLSTRQVELLRYLAERPGQPVSRDELLRQVWHYDPRVASRAVDIAVGRLRKKIEADPGAPDHLRTITGEGYQLLTGAPETAAPAEPAPSLPVALSSFVGRQAEVAALVDRAAEPGLTTLCGLGGTGKTRLALEAAGKLALPVCGGPAPRPRPARPGGHRAARRAGGPGGPAPPGRGAGRRPARHGPRPTCARPSASSGRRRTWGTCSRWR